MGFFPVEFICKYESRVQCMTNGAETLTSYLRFNSLSSAKLRVQIKNIIASISFTVKQAIFTINVSTCMFDPLKYLLDKNKVLNRERLLF